MMTTTTNTTTTNITGNDSTMPDPDAIKMFVGQIPKGWTESDVRAYFQTFGEIFLVNVLRDKVTKQSRGCCFITYYKRKSALDAQNACHNLITLPGMNHPLQIKPADNENRAERKIFVGMLCKKVAEMDLRNLFCRYGLIEECSILRDGNGQSRGCGFVTFSSKACALSAIKGMHHSTTMDGCSSPLVVKFADVQRDKVTKDAIALLTTLADPSTSQKSQYLPVLHLLQQGSCANNFLAQTNAGSHPYGNLVGGIHQSSPTAQNLSLHQQQQSTTNNPTATDMATLTFLANLASNTAANASQGLVGGGCGINNGNLSPTTIGRTSSGFAYNFPAQMEGPDGANLFIYHLPQEFSDTDMIQTFLPFGTILSAKVFIDKNTNLSKCFGFVSFDNSISAHLAIQAMNGFTIGPKRLKVQLKRNTAKDNKPY